MTILTLTIRGRSQPVSWGPEVGSGASGRVYRVEADDRSYAVKVGHGREEAERFAGEAARAAVVPGPHLISVVGGGFTDESSSGRPYLVFPWREGTTLDVVEERTMERRLILAAMLLRDVGEALSDLHRGEVSHGDVKPDNVLLAEGGATLLDLGLADTANRVRPVGGTIRYLAPEVLAAFSGPAGSGPAGSGPAGSGPAGDGRARDLFALGLMVAEVLLPGAAESNGLIDLVRQAELPAPFDRILQPLLSKRPADRPSAEWLLRTVRRLLPDPEDPKRIVGERRRLVHQAYLRARMDDWKAAARSKEIEWNVTGAPRRWLEEALATERAVLALRGQAFSSATHRVEPMSRLDQQRFSMTVVGPVTAAWRLEVSGEAMVESLLELAEHRPLSGLTRQELESRDGGTSREFVSPVELALGFAERPLPRGLLEAVEELENSPEQLAVAAARALRLRGELARARALLADHRGAEALLERALLERRQGDHEAAASWVGKLPPDAPPALRAAGAALVARRLLDQGRPTESLDLLEGAPSSASTAEVRALVAITRGRFDQATAHLAEAAPLPADDEQRARLAAVEGMLAHATGDPAAALRNFERAAELSERAGALLEEATYLTGVAAAASNRGAIGKALRASERALLLFEYLGRPREAARAALARAATFALVGAESELREPAEDCERRARRAEDAACRGYVHLALADGLVSAPREASEHAQRAAHFLMPTRATDNPLDALRAGARLLAHGHAVDVATLDEMGETDVAPDARADWWGARAHDYVHGRRAGSAEGVVEALLALASERQAGVERLPALARGAELALLLGRGSDARRLISEVTAGASRLREGTPESLRRHLEAQPWMALSHAPSEGGVDPEQIAELEALVRRLGTRDRLRPLLEQVLDGLLLWTGVERGLLLLRAPEGKLAVRAARNLARKDLHGEQLSLSQSLARRALELGEPVVAVDAAGDLPDVHRSVHALQLRSVLAVPLMARGEVQGVVYLDDRVRRGAFGARELGWVKLVATLAAVAIADARDQLRLRRAARRAGRAEKRLEMTLSRREAELEVVERELVRVRGGGETRGDYSKIVGGSAPIRAMLRLVDRVAAAEVPVLLQGESGSGKELVARAIHDNGPRAEQSFIAENCAAIPETLLESTLFGHVRGAFTGAARSRTGLFEIAHGGTLFLDEIAEMSPAMQTKLLRVLQEGVIRPVGGERERRVDVRVIAATHRDLRKRVAEGSFREDLFYRLNVITIQIPPLRQRIGDVQLLVRHFVALHGQGRDPVVSPEAMQALAAYDWPGNVRELENEIRRCLVLSDGRIDPHTLSPQITGQGAPLTPETLHLRTRVDALERQLVEEALDKTDGNQTRAAEVLGLSRFGLQKMMKRLGIEVGKSSVTRSGRRSSSALQESR